jgi:hypothetical protein
MFQPSLASVEMRDRLSLGNPDCNLLLYVGRLGAEKEIELLTGLKVSHSSQHRLVQRYELREGTGKGISKQISVDGGKVRLRGEPDPVTRKRGASQWRDYKAVCADGITKTCAAFFQDNQSCVEWVNLLPLGRMVTCIGDGHDGVWNIITQIGTSHQRREVLDWYHLIENLYRVGGSLKRLKRVKGYLWNGFIEEAEQELQSVSKNKSANFLAYLQKHRHRIVDYDLYQFLGIGIGSGAVESTIKRIGRRLKISGAQWKSENIPQMLRLRCAYLNGDLFLSTST